MPLSYIDRNGAREGRRRVPLDGTLISSFLVFSIMSRPFKLSGEGPQLFGLAKYEMELLVPNGNMHDVHGWDSLQKENIVL